MPKNIAYFLDLPDEDFDLDEAMEYYRDLRVETAAYADKLKYMGKLDTRIKGYIRDYGQVPRVANVQTQVIQKRPTEYVTVKDTQLLAGKFMAAGQNEIAQQILALVKVKENTPAIKFIFEDLQFK